MIRHLIVLYLALASILVIGPNPVWILPLLLISASFITGNGFLGLAGVLGFFTVTVGRMPDHSFSDPSGLVALIAGIVLPGIIALDLAFSERPYSIGRPSTVAVGVTAALIVCMAVGMVALSRLGRIGIYLNSDPMLQVFMVVALALLFTGPVLLARGSPGKGQV